MSRMDHRRHARAPHRNTRQRGAGAQRCCRARRRRWLRWWLRWWPPLGMLHGPPAARPGSLPRLRARAGNLQIAALRPAQQAPSVPCLCAVPVPHILPAPSRCSVRDPEAHAGGPGLHRGAALRGPRRQVVPALRPLSARVVRRGAARRRRRAAAAGRRHRLARPDCQVRALVLELLPAACGGGAAWRRDKTCMLPGKCLHWPCCCCKLQPDSAAFQATPPHMLPALKHRA